MTLTEQTSNHMGRRIAQAREARHLSQVTLAQIVGTKPNYLSQIENGFRSPGFQLGVRLAHTLDIPLADLLPAAPASETPIEEPAALAS